MAAHACGQTCRPAPQNGRCTRYTSVTFNSSKEMPRGIACRRCGEWGPSLWCWAGVDKRGGRWPEKLPVSLFLMYFY